VKGLDFALLNKVRAELNKQKKVEEVQSLDEFPASRSQGGKVMK
jgi:predicted secreted protein